MYLLSQFVFSFYVNYFNSFINSMFIWKAVTRAEEGKEVIYTNVGNPQALGQNPLTFPRQVLSLSK